MGITFERFSAASAKRVYDRNGVSIRHAEADECDSVLLNMRPIDQHEFEAVGCDPWEHGRTLLRVAHEIYIADVDREPAFVFGTLRTFPHVRMIFGFGTKRAKRAIPAVTWFAQTYLRPKYRDEGVTRCEVRIPASCKQSRKWLETAFDAQVEASLPGYSVTGEKMLQLSGAP